MSIVVAWDIDGTLLRTGGAGRTALDRAFSSCFGVAGVYDQVDFRGRTDWTLVAEAFDVAGRVPSQADKELLRNTYLKMLEEELQTKADRMHVCPGAADAIAEIGKLAHSCLLTGNWRAGARLKLGAAGLAAFFERDGFWGAFGDDGHERNELVPVLRKRASERGLNPTRVILIGDTPADVACARADGAEVVAVATGGCTYEELHACQPDLLLSDLVSGRDALLEFFRKE